MFLDKVVEDAIQDCTDEVVRDTVREMASDHMRVSSAAAVVDELVLDHLQDIQRGLVSLSVLKCCSTIHGIPF